MSEPVCETIMVAVEARLAALAGTPQVRRNPDAPAYALNSIDLYDGAQSEPESDSATSRYTMDIEMEMFESGGTELNLLYARVVEALLGGATWWAAGMSDLREGARSPIDIGTTDGQAAVAGYMLTFHIDYWTRDGDPFAAGP